MGLLISPTPFVLWHDVIKYAENQCRVSLEEELESYLAFLLMRYTNKPEVAKQIVATAFLEAMQHTENQRNLSLQHVGDQCLLFAGLFPKIAEKRRVKISYFVHLGRSAYRAVSATDDLFGSLALQFVVLMDVLQSIRHCSDLLLPIEAYEQWNEVGSQRAFKILQEYTIALRNKTR